MGQDSGDIILTACGLRKSHAPGRDALVLHRLDVRRGEFLAIAGPSGGGKSTLVNLLAGFQQPDAGLILKNGRPLPPPGPDRMPVFQDHALFPWYTVAENVAYSLKSLGLSPGERSRRVARTLELVGLAGAAGLYPAELSGGMRQRAALARALIPEPEILLLDEPFASQDEGTKSQLHGELLRMWREYSPTIIMVTHDLREAALLADRIALLRPPPAGLEKIFPVGLPRSERADHPEIRALVHRLEGLLGAQNT